MIKRSKLLYKTVALLPLMATLAMADSVCGPGINWVATCSTGATYQLEALFTNAVTLNDTAPGGAQNLGTVQFEGTSDISLGTAGGSTVSTDLYSIVATMVGGTATLTAGVGNGLPDSIGSITQNSDGLTATSFFDVFFELNFGGGVVLYNEDPLVVTTTLSELPIPVGTIFTESPGGVSLYLRGDPTTVVGQLASGTKLIITPEPGTWPMAAGGLLLAAGLLRRKRQQQSVSQL
jgi:hypothetical protein